MKKGFSFIAVLVLVLFFGCFGGTSSSSSNNSNSGIPRKVISAARMEAIGDGNTFIRVKSASKVGGEAMNGDQVWRMMTEVENAIGQKMTVPYGAVINE